MARPPEEHAENWDLRHEDFNDNDFLYDVYSVMRQRAAFSHTEVPFLSATPGGAWVATRYADSYRILQDWEHFSSNPTPEVNYASAKRDAEEFADPDRCILDRAANRHLGFGAGVHRCLGSNLARLEFRIGIEQVLARIPDYTLAPGAPAIFHGNSVTRGFRCLPVEFSPGRGSAA